jgi:two-component system, response regulator YesN
MNLFKVRCVTNVFKMLIVDDEPIICRGLRYTIPWDEYQIQVVDEAADGYDAIQKIKLHQNIDIVLTDVRMPNLDGIELAKFLNQHCPQTKTIILSGYDEFEYAKQAIQLGVKDYLLKPVNIDDLLKVVKKITVEIESEQTKLKDFYQVKLKNDIYHLVSGVTIEEAEESQLFDSIQIYPFLSAVDDYYQTTRGMSAEELKAFKFNWRTSIEQLLKKEGIDSISIFTGKNLLLTCLFQWDGPILPHLSNLVDLPFSLTYILGEGQIALSALPQGYERLSQRVKYIPLHPKAFLDATIAAERTETREYPKTIERDLTEAVFATNHAEMKRLIQCLFDYFKAQLFFLEEVVPFCVEFVGKISKRFRALCKGSLTPCDLHFKHSLDTNCLNSYEILQELFSEDLACLVNTMNRNALAANDWLIERAENYIKEYYTSDIKAYEVADVINISPNYFSSLFKQKTGKHFNEYVNELRVEKAKILLEETPYKINEISETVGFREYKYFVDVFRRFSGTTPTKYRKLMTNKSEGAKTK